MVAFSLLRARSKRYSHAARHLHTCRVLARGIKDWGHLQHHSTYVTGQRCDHGRNYGFWSLVPQEVVPESEPTGNSKAAKSDGPSQAASPAASPSASGGPLQPGLWRGERCRSGARRNSRCPTMALVMAIRPA
jgi:hypothetical protein